MIITFSRSLTNFHNSPCLKETENTVESKCERKNLFFGLRNKAKGKLNSHGEDKERSMQEVQEQQLQQKPTANHTDKTLQHQNHCRQLQ